MRRPLRLLIASLLLLAVVVPTAAATPRSGDKITLCHRVGGPNYVVITIAPEAALNGHAKNHPLDIIPAFTFSKGGTTVRYPGQNLNEEGVAILGNQCVAPLPPADPGDEGDDTHGGGGDHGHGTEIAICHRLASGNFEEEWLSPRAAVDDHADHPHDVIPAFSYEAPSGMEAFDGQNLDDDGIALLANGCQAMAVDETPDPGQPLVELAKSAVDVDGGTLVPGDVVRFTIVATNHGSAAASNVVITDPVSAGTAYVRESATVAPGSVDVADGYVVATVGALAPGGSATLSFSVRLDDDLPAGAMILDVGRSTSTGPGGKEHDGESNRVELPVDTPPVVPIRMLDEPPVDSPPAGTDMPVLVEITPNADLEQVSVCAELQIPARAGAAAMGTMRTACAPERSVARGVRMRSMIHLRIPRSAAGRCVRLATVVSAHGYAPRERTERLCVRRAGPAEPVTG